MLVAPFRSVGLCVASFVLVGSLVALAPESQARPEGPRSQDHSIARVVSLLMERRHVGRRGLDDQVSQNGLTEVLKQLDPFKLYFFQSDVDEFAAFATKLDDQIKSGDVSFAYKVFDRFLQRVEERTQLAQQYIDVAHDFTVEEEMVKDREKTQYAKTPEEASDLWRRRVKFDLMTELAEDVKLEEAQEKLRKRYRSLAKRWEQTDSDELLELYLSSVASCLDPHTNYMSPSTLDNFEIQMGLKLDGIGASLRAEDGETEVVEIIPGGAADVDGRLKKGDRIIGVGQGPDGAIEDVVDLKLNDVVNRVRGQRGTVVRLEVKPVDRPGEREIYNITRAEIKLTTQEARSQVVEAGTKPSGEPYRLGVISLPSFYMDMDAARRGDVNYKSTTRDVRRLLESLNRDGVDCVVVDLRFNGGGSLTEAVNMTGLFIDKGPVVQVKDPNGRTPYFDNEAGMVWSGPLVVVTNKFSASASEIFAGAIQDYGRGIVIGDEATHGKGTVQQLEDLGDAIFSISKRPNLGALKLTIQQFYRPDGDSTQNRGVLANVSIPSLTSQLEVGEADLDHALAFDTVQPLTHSKYNMLDQAVIGELQTRSKQRVEASEDFAKELKRIAAFNEQKGKPTVTLVLAKYLEEIKKLDVNKEQEKTFEELQSSDRPVFDTENYYNREVMSIIVDYLELLKNNRVAIAR